MHKIVLEGELITEVKENESLDAGLTEQALQASNLLSISKPTN
ncbi:hypothetical protein [Rodentibacter pneumotropicus]|nr:hypothetical protein [Rodentibacter pneumotropicus]